MSRTVRHCRRGMTMIELLVVIGLIMLIASLALVISPRMIEDQRAVRGADLISGWLYTCKNRAYRDQQDRGLRLVQDPNNPLQVKECVFIERPVDYRGGKLVAPSPYSDPAFPYPTATVFIQGVNLENSFDPLNPIVQPGDFLVFDTLETPPYNSHMVYKLQYIPALNGTHVELANAAGTRPSIVNGGNQISSLPLDRFRFVRQPRPMAGESVLQLPRDMVIDLDTVNTPGASFLPGNNLDIMFTPRGQISGLNSIGGKIALRLRNGSRAPTDGDQIYVVVYTRSGLITTHPVNFTPDPVTGLIDYYLFLKDGNSSGF